MPNEPEPRADDLRPEYDLTTLQGGVRGKYMERFQAGTNLARLDPDVRDAFPTDAEVNRALRSLMPESRPPGESGTTPTGA